ncbi:hypothetical protein Droror1_Dr00019631 [Drosera rotundifolia]
MLTLEFSHVVSMEILCLKVLPFYSFGVRWSPCLCLQILIHSFHRDDIADLEKWSKRLNCERNLHSTEVQESTVGVERKLEGTGPWNLYPDIELIHTPGHTEGSVCLYHKSLKVLFTGDDLAWLGSRLHIWETFNWFSVPLQLESVKKLLNLDFEWILPACRSW